MKRIFLLAAMLMVTLSPLHERAYGDTWYVDTEKNGDGSSWENAIGDLQSAVSAVRISKFGSDTILNGGSSDEDTVKLRGGQIHYPTGDAGRENSFWLPPRITLLGGYQSDGVSRDLKNARTVLDGNIGTPNDTDNCFHIVSAVGNCVIDGFLLRNGRTDTTVYYDNARGGALLAFNDSTFVKNCRFEDNKAAQGGAIAVHGPVYSNSLFIEECIFEDNYSIGEGGAVYGGCGKIFIWNTDFIENSTAGLGGAVAFYGDSICLNDVRCISNSAGQYGGGLYLRTEKAFIGGNSVLDSNTAGIGNGGAVYIECDTISIENTSFTGNSAGYRGGALCFLGKKVTASNLQCISNIANQGAAFHLFQDVGFDSILTAYSDDTLITDSTEIDTVIDIPFDSRMAVKHCSFLNNMCTDSNAQGGAIHWLGKGEIVECNFENNTSDYGGAIATWFHNVGDKIHFRTNNRTRFRGHNFRVNQRWVQAEIDSTHTARIINCSFENNKAYSGSSIANWNGLVFGCLFDGDTTEIGTVTGLTSTDGNDTMSVLNCTFVNNVSSYVNYAGLRDCKGPISNSIFWNGEHGFGGCSTPTYSIIENWLGGGTGNSTSNPQFIGGGLFPYRLSDGSPAIDSGDIAMDTADIPTEAFYDLYGSVRYSNNRIDIGATEHHRGHRYVDSRAMGDNNGSSWADAYQKLEDAIANAIPGDSIWVATGVYVPTDDGSRDSSFYLNNIQAITLVGGFKGDEEFVEERNFRNYPTTLSGDIGAINDTSDNTFTIIKTSQTRDITIDGFKICNATNYGNGGGIQTTDCNGYLFVKNCEFTKNFTGYAGSAIKIGFAQIVVFKQCIFNENVSDIQPVFSFSGCMALNNVSIVEIVDCSFYNNSSLTNGASGIDFFHCGTSSIKNSTFNSYNNTGSGNATIRVIGGKGYSSGKLNIQNTIIYNTSNDSKEIYLHDNSICSITSSVVKGGIDSIYVSDTSTLNISSTIFSFDPLFSDAENGDLSLSYTSPCIDRGTTVDTTGWGGDIRGLPRIHNGTIDLGAYEFQSEVMPDSPMLLGTLNSFTIEAGGSLTIDLNQKNSDSSGYYVQYLFRDISELVWWANSNDTAAHTLFDPENNLLTVTCGASLRPGMTFTIGLRASDPDYSSVYSEKTAQFTVIGSDFELCGAGISQDTGSSNLYGVMEVKNTIDPIILSGGRLYLADTVSTSIDQMQYLQNVTVTETAPPASRGGDEECGRYEFTIVPTSSIVYNSNGISTGKTLFQWATEESSRWPGSVYYQAHGVIQFILPPTNEIEGVKYFSVDCAADFTGPFTRMYVSSYTHHQKVRWDAFDDVLQSLTLYRTPLGDGAPPPDSVVYDSLTLSTTSFLSDSLEDSRTYNYRLKAVDIYGNIAETEIEGTTASGRYTLSGWVQPYNVPRDTVVRVRVERVEESGDVVAVDDMLIELDSVFIFSGLVNASYRISVDPIAIDSVEYSVAPIEIDTTILRGDVSALTFTLMPDAVMDYNAMRVEQLPGSGDLKFTVKTKSLFIDEKPSRLYLKWEGGLTTTAVDSQIIPVDTTTLTEVASPDGSALWTFIVPRSTVEDSIFNNGKVGFEANVRYINSVLETSAYGYSAFRTGLWSWPLSPDMEQLLFSAQRFVQPAPPRLSQIFETEDDMIFAVSADSHEPGLVADVVFISHATNDTADARAIDVGDYSEMFRYGSGSVPEWYVRHLDWNNARESRSGPNGEMLLSGILIDSTNTDSTILPTLGVCGRRDGDTGTVSDSVPYCSWRLRIDYPDAYWMWMYLDRAPEKTTEVYVSFGEPTDGKKHRFIFYPGMETGWVRVWKSNASHDEYENYPPRLTEGMVNVNVYCPQGPISVSAIALKRGVGREWPDIEDAIGDLQPRWGSFMNYEIVHGFNLTPNSMYRMIVRMRDRYGNVSTPVEYDTLITRDQYMEGSFALHETEPDGDLVIDFNLPDTSIQVIDSIIFKFGGEEYPINLNQPVSFSDPQVITLDRSTLDSLLDVETFKRHTVYDSLYLVFASQMSFITVLPRTVSCNNLTECTDHCDDPHISNCSMTTTTRRTKYGVFLGPLGITVYETKDIVSRDCSYDRTDTIPIIYRTPRIAIPWPEGDRNQVASQEYREVTAPQFTIDTITARSVALSCTTLNIADSATMKEQMAGKVIVTWRPGSVCLDSSSDTLQFGNRFTMDGNWIAFMPSFEGAIASNVGIRRTNGTLTNRHQWIDRYSDGNPLQGGEFYPNIGYSITAGDLADLSEVPSISMGITLSDSEASADTVTPSEQFHLWVLPAKLNGPDNRYFYWGVDGVPVVMGDAFCDDTTTWVWSSGPDVYLLPGDHTIDIFMRDDGVGIAGIALSKENTAPPIGRAALTRWGNAGFNCALLAEDLPSASPIDFTAKAIDRFGNVSSEITVTCTTLVNDEDVPGIVISPSLPLENGFYHSIYPSFTLSADKQGADSLTVETQLVWNHSGTIDTLSNLIVTLVDTAAHIWFAEVDSTSPLSPFPVDTAATATNGYAIRARSVSSNATSGDWSQLVFGVVPDTGEVPPTIVVLDSIYETPALDFRFDHGIETATYTIIGDLEILFDSSVVSSGVRMMLEGATIYTDTTVDSMGTVIHNSITAVSGGTIVTYQCSDYYYECSRAPLFAMNYGRFSVEAPSDSLELADIGGGVIVVNADGAVIYDDNGTPTGLSASLTPGSPLRLTRKGIADTCYATQDRFFMENVLTFHSASEGFSLNGCRMVFAHDTATSDYSMVAMGKCATCGPDLVYTVLSPRYLDEEFSAFDRLDEHVRLTYTASDHDYQVDFSGGPYNVTTSSCVDKQYRGWGISLHTYTFYTNGITVSDFSLKLPEEPFPADKNSGDGIVNGFSGLRISGDPDVNDGALHCFDTAKAAGTAIELVTANDYLFRDIDTLRFVSVGNVDYQLTAFAPCSLETPSESSGDFNKTGKNLTLTIHRDTGFVLSPYRIEQVYASGPFELSIGTIGSGNTMVIEGLLEVTFAANDFQLKVLPNGTDTLITIAKDFFIEDVNRGTGTDDVGVSQASIGLFSDFTINTLYAKKDDGNTYKVNSSSIGIPVGLPSKGFDIFKTDGDGPAGIRVLLLAPQLPFDGLTELFPEPDENDCVFTPSIYNAGYDLTGKLTNISGRIDLPDDVLRCFGVGGLGEITDQIAKFKLKTIYVGLEEDDHGEDLFTVGADATIELGKVFNPIGLMGEKIALDKVTAGYSSEGWGLTELHASAFMLPRIIGIGPKNFSEKSEDEESAIEQDRNSGTHYIELYTGGKGMALDYLNGATELKLKNWQLRATDEFPIEALRGVSFNLDSMVYANGKIKDLVAAGVYIPPDGKLRFGDVELRGVEMKLAYESTKEMAESSNETNINAYFEIALGSLFVGGKPLPLVSSPDCQNYFRIYFDGRVSGQGCAEWSDTIGVVPWGDTINPDIFIAPETSVTTVEFSFDTEKGFTFTLEGARLRSNYVVPVLNREIDVAISEFSFGYDADKGRFGITSLDATWFIYEELLNNSAFRMAVNEIRFKYEENTSELWANNDSSINLGRKFCIFTTPDFQFKLSEHCTEAGIQPEAGLIIDIDADDDVQRGSKTNFVWRVDGSFDCDLAGFGFGADFVINSDTLGFQKAYLEMNDLEEFGMIKNNGEKAEDLFKDHITISGGDREIKAGVLFENVYWVRNSRNEWRFNTGAEGFKVRPTFDLKDQAFEVCGVGIKGDFNFERLFAFPHPGIGYENIRVMLKDNDLPTNMNLYIDNVKPYLHVEFDQPSVFTIQVPSIALTENFTLGEALIQIGTEANADLGYDSWFVRGKAHMSLKPVISALNVDIAFEKPHPWENTTGIRHARVTIEMDSTFRIPLGTTPFYISGFEGALYDGQGMPKSAIECGIPSLPPGLKVEAAMFLEFEDPRVAKGKLGFWVHLRRFNLGINGEVVALNGIADASACAAIYNNGEAFHGAFETNVQLGLTVSGDFTVDIWNDATGGNFTSSANASVGLKRGSLFKKWWLKIPSKNKKLGSIFVNAGKFSNNATGLTGGIRLVGKTWGVGIIGKKFKVGNMGKYRLKQPPILSGGGFAKRLAAIAVGTRTTDNVINPGYVFEGGEVISLITATDSGSYVWEENALRVYDASTNIPDYDDANYCDPGSDDSLCGKLVVQENIAHRVWVNNNGYDSIYVAIPMDNVKTPADSADTTLPPHGAFEHLFMAGLKPATIALEVEPLYDSDSILQQVTFNGRVHDFQGTMRNLLRFNGSDNDTVLRQKMDLLLMISQIAPREIERDMRTSYVHNYLPIPLAEFDGFGVSDTSLIDNPNVDYDSINRELEITDLVWRPNSGTAPGTFVFCASVQTTDYVVEDSAGNPMVLPDSLADEAGIYTDAPIVLPSDTTADDTVMVTIYASEPVGRPVGFTATGSAASVNWASKDETRSIFLRWEKDDNPALSGYEIAWYPSSDTQARSRRTAIIGKTDHYTITIPSIDSLYTDNCDSAKGIMDIVWDTTLVPHKYTIMDSTGTEIDTIVYDTLRQIISATEVRPNRLCPATFSDAAFYLDSVFNVVITPLRDTINYKDIDAQEVAGREPDYVNYAILSDSAVIDSNIALGVNRGNTTINTFEVTFIPDDTTYISGGVYNDSIIDVPLNSGMTIPANIAVDDVSGIIDPSRYGELQALVAPYSGTVPGNALPRAGAIRSLFTVGPTDDTITAALSLTPIEKTQSCAEIFSHSCGKVLTDSNGIADTAIEVETCGECSRSGELYDPSHKDNDLPLNNPCNGYPDAVYRQRSPFTTYTAKLFAINNGRRTTPIFDNDNFGPVVYDSLLFRVTPPEPVLHDVMPGYVLNGRYDTLSLAISSLWLDTSALLTPAVVVSYTDTNGVTQQMPPISLTAANIIPMAEGADNVNWEFEGAAEWDVRIPSSAIYVPGDGELTCKVAVVNRDYMTMSSDTVQTFSNEMEIAFVDDPEGTECPDWYYPSDSTNANYVMDWIGNFPRNVSAGDTIYSRFTELHDLDPTHYTVRVVCDAAGKLDDTITLSLGEYKIGYDGIQLILPDTIQSKNSNVVKVLTKINSSSSVDYRCKIPLWGKNDSIFLVPPRHYSIIQENNGFRIVTPPADTVWRYLDIVEYAIGENNFERLPRTGYEHRTNPPQYIPLSQSATVHARITDLDGNNEEWKHKRIEVEMVPHLVYPDGSIVPDSFSIEPGDTLYIESPRPAYTEPSEPMPYHCYHFNGSGSECNTDMIIFDAGARSPITIERRTELYANAYSNNGYRNILEGSRSYTFSIRGYTRDEITAITIPSARLLTAASQPVKRYPLLLRIDTTVVPNLPTLLTGAFHFRSANMLPLPFEVEELDSAAARMTVWVKVDMIDPGIGNNTIYMVAGTAPAISDRVWNGFRALWHCSSDTSLTDMSGNGYTLPAAGTSVDTGLIVGSRRFSGSPITAPAGAPALLNYNVHALTLSAWIHMDSIPATGSSIISCADRFGENVCELAVTGDTALFFTVGSDTLQTIRGAVEDGCWLNVAAVYRGENDSVALYVNGLRIAFNGAFRGADNLDMFQGTVIIGDDFHGRIDELRIAPQAYGTSRIALDYHTQRGRNEFLREPVGFTSVTALSHPQFRLTAAAKSGDWLAHDTSLWQLQNLPPDLQGLTLLRMPWADRLSDADTLCTVSLNGSAIIYLLFDADASTLPSFITPFTATGRTVRLKSMTGAIDSLTLFTVTTAIDTTILLGGPADDGSDADLPYAVLIDGTADGSFTIATGAHPFITNGTAQVGELLYSDRDYVFDSLPTQLQGGIVVQTPNAWRFSDTLNAVTAQVNRNANVSLLLDTAMTSWPGFVINDNQWETTGMLVRSDRDCFTVLRRSIDQHANLTTDGIRNNGGTGNRTGYTFIVNPIITSEPIIVTYPDDYVITPLDSGAIPYIDSMWYIRELPLRYQGARLIQTRQSAFNDTSSRHIEFELLRSLAMYVAIDANQEIMPTFISDNSGGIWVRQQDVIKTSVGGVYIVYRKFFRNEGTYAFSGARSGGDSLNAYNYFIFADTSMSDGTITVEPSHLIVQQVKNVTGPYINSQVRFDTTDALYPQIADKIVLIDSLTTNICRNIRITTDKPVRIWFCVDPVFLTAGTFLEYDGWEETPYRIALTGTMKDRIVWRKEFAPGEIVLPGIQCDIPQPGIQNPIIMIETLEHEVLGFSARDLAVRGFGDERSASSTNYQVSDLDVVYALDFGLSSRSWLVDITARSAVADRGDTMYVLSPFSDDVILSIGDTTIVREGDRFSLADLMPIFVAADSVEVNAIDLTARGSVRIAFNNTGEIAVTKEFVVLLFEDRNNDFQWTPETDYRFGSVVVRGIGAGESKVYRIGLNDTIAFPNRTMFAFVDARDDIPESYEFNNITSGGGGCDGYYAAEFQENDTSAQGYDSVSARIPVSADTVLFGYFGDTNGDSLVDSDDSLYALFIYNYQLYCINESGDSLFSAVAVNGSDPAYLKVDDVDNDGIPEIIAGNMLFDNEGQVVWDATLGQSGLSAIASLQIDFNDDNVPDSISFDEADSCITVWCGRDTILLYTYPAGRWSGEKPFAVEVLASVLTGDRYCYDANVSFPRYAIVGSDSADVTIRVANAGRVSLWRGVGVSVYADTFSVFDSATVRVPVGAIDVGASITAPLQADSYEDVRFTVTLPAATKRIWFVVDSQEWYFEASERDNVLWLGVE